MGTSSSSSRTETTNITTTNTATIANAFNNALNTTQNFSNIGGYTPEGGRVFGDFNWTTVLLGIAGALAFFILLKR